MGEYHIFVHPNRKGNGPALWGYLAQGEVTEIIFGSLTDSYRHLIKPKGYWIHKVPDKTRKGYVALSPFPANKLDTFVNHVRGTMSNSLWPGIALNGMDAAVARALKDLRVALGLSPDHPTDGLPVQAKPSPRTANPEPTMVVRLPPKKTVSWMF